MPSIYDLDKDNARRTREMAERAVEKERQQKAGAGPLPDAYKFSDTVGKAKGGLVKKVLKAKAKGSVARGKK